MAIGRFVGELCEACLGRGRLKGQRERGGRCGRGTTWKMCRDCMGKGTIERRIPRAFEAVQVGDPLTVKREMFSRGGQTGFVVDPPGSQGVSLDFFTCGQCGAKACACYTSVEFWNYGEIEPPGMGIS